MSSRVHSYLLRLKSHNEVKVSKYGKSDVPFLTSNADLAKSTLLSNLREHFRYTIPIHITGELNHETNQEGIRRLVQQNNASDEFRYTGKSEEIDRLWSMFCLIYEDTPTLKHSMPLSTSGAKTDVIQYLVGISSTRDDVSDT